MTKIDKTRFFFAKKRCYTTSNCSMKSHFNQPKIERKNCVWTTSRLSEMCIFQHVEMKSVFTFQPIKRLVSTTTKSAKPDATFWIFFLVTKNRQLCCLAVMEHIVLQERRVAITKNHLRFWINFSTNHNQAHPNLNHEKTNQVQLWNKRIRFLLVDDLSNISFFRIILCNFNLLSTHQTYSTYSQLTEKIMIFSVSNDGIQWTLDFGPDSVTIAVNDLEQNITISSQEIPLAAWQLLLSQRQYFLDNHLSRVPITPNQEGTMEMRDEVLSSVGAQDLDTSSYQVSDPEDIEFNWENSQLEMDAVFRPGIDTPFSPTIFDDLSMEGSVENPLCWTKRKTRRMLVHHQHPSLSDPRILPGCREVVHLEQE